MSLEHITRDWMWSMFTGTLVAGDLMPQPCIIYHFFLPSITIGTGAPMTLRQITRDWMIGMFITKTIMTYSYTISIVYLWNQLQAKHNAISGIIVAGISAFIAYITLRNYVRRFILKYGVWITVVASTIDAVTELFLLIDPFTKLLGDVIAGPITQHVVRQLLLERKCVIYSDPNDRVQFDLKYDMVSYLAHFIGCGTVLIYEPDIPTVVGIAVFANVLQVITLMWRFSQTDNYMARHGLRFSVTQ